MSTITAETSIIINAPIEKVWQIMLDVANYPSWNSFVIKAETEGDVSKEGTKMKLVVKWKNGGSATSNEIIGKTSPVYIDNHDIKQAYWSYRFTGILDTLGLVRAVRYQWLEEEINNTTSYRTREEFQGLLKNFIPLANVQEGFERHAADLKRKAEASV